MSVQSVALASLAATYSDSEGEDGVDVDDEAHTVPSQAAAPHNNQVGQPQGTISPKFAKSATNSPVIPKISNTNNLENISIVHSSTSKKVQRLVSYLDDTIVHDEEVNIIPDEAIGSQSEASLPLEEMILDDLIPPEPSGQCPQEMQEKISALHRKMETDGLELNNVIQQRKDLKNPSIYEKLVQFCKINELGTNYSPEIFDPFKWGKESYYEELAEAQDELMKKLAKKSSKAKVSVATGTTKRSNENVSLEENVERRNNGKWDLVTTGASTSGKTTVTTTNLGASDKKCKVIVAFGVVPKKRM